MNAFYNRNKKQIGFWTLLVAIFAIVVPVIYGMIDKSADRKATKDYVDKEILKEHTNIELIKKDVEYIKSDVIELKQAFKESEDKEEKKFDEINKKLDQIINK